MSDDTVNRLVEDLISKKAYYGLNQLHSAFDNGYWKYRFSIVKKSCYTYDDITVPDQIGLLQFCQLRLRRQNIIERKAPYFEVKQLNSKLHTRPRMRIGNIGHRFFVTDNSHLNKGLHLNKIQRMGQFASIVPIHDNIARNSTTLGTDRPYKDIVLAEPFILRFSHDKFSVAYLPSPMNFQSEFTCGTLYGLPQFADAGNSDGAKSRLIPVITGSENGNTLILKFKLIRICAEASQIKIEVIWECVIDSCDEEHLYPNMVLYVNLSHAAFAIRYDKWANGHLVAQKYICLVSFSNLVTKKVPLFQLQNDESYYQMFIAENNYNDFHLVGDTVFYHHASGKNRILCPPFGNEPPSGMNNRFVYEEYRECLEVYRIDFDAVQSGNGALGEAEPSIFDQKRRKNYFDLVCKVDIQGVAKNDIFFLGSHLYIQSANGTKTLFLDKNVNINTPLTKSNIYENYPIGSKGASLSIDVVEDAIQAEPLRPNRRRRNRPRRGNLRFRVYLDDEHFLQSEINKCLLCTS